MATLKANLEDIHIISVGTGYSEQNNANTDTYQAAVEKFVPTTREHWYDIFKQVAYRFIPQDSKDFLESHIDDDGSRKTGISSWLNVEIVKTLVWDV